ncbi:MAG: hypothetical protein CL834_04175 [Crocinitomicaceae bacterium]|nr:hypothetical protein [Crocinitomicaceae bacterium]
MRVSVCLSEAKIMVANETDYKSTGNSLCSLVKRELHLHTCVFENKRKAIRLKLHELRFT